MRPRIIIKGDEELGQYYVEIALLELQKLKNLMKFQGLDQNVRKTVFDDGTVIRCHAFLGQDIITIETQPVEKEEEEEKEYEEGALLIVLRKIVNNIYDYWYWDIEAEKGYHENPGATAPLEPEIVTKWWTCSGNDEVLVYTRATPTLIIIASGGAGDSCGLINFGAWCCNSPQGSSDEVSESWLCPCGGTGKTSVYPEYGQVCEDEIACSGGNCGEAGSEAIVWPSAKSSSSFTSNQSTDCIKGYSWLVSIGSLSEKIEVGPRTKVGGSESSSIASLKSSKCDPIMSQYFQCENMDWEGCFCDTWYDPTYLSTKCDSPPCTGWMKVEGEGMENKGRRRVIVGWSWGTEYQGEISYTRLQKSGSYSTWSVPLKTVVMVGSRKTEFSGSWSEYLFSGNSQEGDFVHCFPTQCLSCSNSGELGPSESRVEFSYSELSYGIAGWRTVVVDDDRFAVLMPKLSVSATAVSVDGDASGSINSETTVILRIVDDGEVDYELASAEKNYSLASVPNGRDDLGINPNCYSSREIPLENSLGGFHWLVEKEMSGDDIEFRKDNILVAFVMNGVFYAHLAHRDMETPWQNSELSAFEQWAVDNDLESYAMFLYRRREDEEEVYY